MNWKIVLADDLTALGLPPAWQIRYCLTNRIAYFMFLLRVTEHFSRKRGLKRVLYYPFRLKLDRVSERLGFDIPLHTFGAGLSIAHRGSIVVNGDARIGRNCRIHPGVTIGAVRGISPIIEDDVFIGPGVGIYGDVRIGQGATLGPNSLVNFSVGPNKTTVSGRATILDREKKQPDREEDPWRRRPMPKK